MNIGERIRTRRNELGITQNELAERLNVTRSAVSNWETEKNYPDLQTIVRISEELDVSLDTLLKGDADVVEKITKDTKESRKLRGRSKKLIVIISVLALVIAAAVYLNFFWSCQVSRPDQVRSMKIAGNDLVIDLDMPKYCTRSSWMAGSGEKDGIAEISIDYEFGRARPRDKVLKIGIDQGDEHDVFSEKNMKKMKQIRIVTKDGKVVKTLKITDDMRK